MTSTLLLFDQDANRNVIQGGAERIVAEEQILGYFYNDVACRKDTLTFLSIPGPHPCIAISQEKRQLREKEGEDIRRFSWAIQRLFR